MTLAEMDACRCRGCLRTLASYEARICPAAMARAIRYAAHFETNEAGQTNCVDLLALADRIESGEVIVK